MKNLKNKRIKAGFKTRKSFAMAMGVSLTTCQNWEDGITLPGIENMKKIEKLLNKGDESDQNN